MNSRNPQPQSFSGTGKELPLRPGDEMVLLDQQGSGVLRHMWFGGDWPGFDRTLIRFYVDGETEASIAMRLFLGHGIGFCDPSPWGTARLGKTGSPSGLYNTLRVPFGSRLVVTAQSSDEVTASPPFWWILRGDSNPEVVIADYRLPPAARLRLQVTEDITVEPSAEFDICNVKHGAGALYFTTLEAESTNDSYQEGCLRGYVDGSPAPLMISSGLEDYFLGTYYFNRGPYHYPLAGVTHRIPGSRLAAYRLHDDDPVYFTDGFRLTLRCGDEVDGRIIHDPQLTRYTTYVWTYQWNEG